MTLKQDSPVLALIAERAAAAWNEPKKPRKTRKSEMGKRREFSMALRIAIVNRASDAQFNIHCELCGVFCKSRQWYQIDHVIPEAERPDADREKALVAADGQLLCLRCHGAKTRVDKKDIAKIARQTARHLGIEKANKRKIRSRSKAPKEPYKPAAGEPRISRQYGSPRGLSPPAGRDGTG